MHTHINLAPGSHRVNYVEMWPPRLSNNHIHSLGGLLTTHAFTLCTDLPADSVTRGCAQDFCAGFWRRLETPVADPGQSKQFLSAA